MIQPLADDEESRFLGRLSPNGTDEDYIEVWLTRVSDVQMIELRQMRPERPAKRVSAASGVEQARSVFPTAFNIDELFRLLTGSEAPPWLSA